MNAQRNPKRTEVGIELVRQLAAEGDRIFSTARARELGARVELKDSYLIEALHHLSRNGWIVPLRRGLYALSSSVPGVASVHEFEVAMALVNPAAVSHWSALHFHGLTEQIPGTVFVLTTTEVSIPRVRCPRTDSDADGYRVGGTFFRFVQVKPHRYFGTVQTWVGEARVTVTDPERTLLDGLSTPRFCGDFAEVLHAFDLRGRDLDVDRIVGYALKLDASATKRLGWVLEGLGVEETSLARLVDRPIKGYRKLDPTGPRAGPRNRRWMIQENLPGRIAG